MSDNSHSTGKTDRGGLFDRLRSLFGAQPTTVREDIEDALEESSERDFTAQERTMLRSILGLHDLRVRDVMVPRTDITAVATTDTLGHVLELFCTAGHSRLPVYEDSLDAPQGMIHIRDFLGLLAKLSAAQAANLAIVPPSSSNKRFGDIDLSAALPLGDVMRQVLFVPPSMPVLDLLVRMQTERTHMALVIDEYGGTDGLVSIEDVVEVIVGDIEDEHDNEAAPRMEKTAAGDFVIDGRAPLDEAIAFTGVDFTRDGDREGVDTVAGYAANVAGTIPDKGDVIRLTPSWVFEIVDADRGRIKLVKLKRDNAIADQTDSQPL